ncbi:multidrug transporter [Massilia phosphatilytica]|nr:multidrug transporter [Massilia phosphatilytica]
MHIGKSYGLFEFLHWTRRRIYALAAVAGAVVALYQLGGWHWLSLPWPVLALLGTAASFIVGFKNSQSYGRTVEAQQIWSSITAASRYWGLLCRDFPTDEHAVRDLVARHLAWLTAVRYELRAPRVWEAAASVQNAEYQERTFVVAEHRVPLEAELARYLAPDTVTQLLAGADIPGALISMQSRAIRALFHNQALQMLQYAEMQKTLKDLIDQHARAQRIKNFPYPRQYAIVNSLFVWLFALLLPLGTVKEFARLDAPAFMDGQTAWLAIPFSVLIGWMYLALDQVGESTENPFEGSANDVPITYIARSIEQELSALHGLAHEPPPPPPGGHILL